MTYPLASFNTSEGTYSPDRLVVGDSDALISVGGDVRVPGGETLGRGTLLGGRLSVESGADDGNTATLTPSSVAVGVRAQVGRYILRVTTAGNASTQRYALYAPDGRQLATGIQSGTANSANGHVTLTVTGSGTNAVVGDSVYFDVSIDRYAKINFRAIDGTQRPAAILAQDAENTATAAATIGGVVYTQGQFDWNVVDDVTDEQVELSAIQARLGRQGLHLLDTNEHTLEPRS